MTAFASPVQWLPDGIPHNPRFNDRYRGDGDDGLGGILQARHVFLGGCDLPGAWRDAPRWTLLETGFGLGLNFLATWQAWRADPLAPQLLHYVAIEAWPPTADDLQRGAAPYPELAPLAHELAARWTGLLPGFHRLAFEGGRVQLTLCIGEVRAMLRELRFEADSVYLDGFTPALNPDMWDPHTLKAVSHLCRRGTRVATWTIARSVRDGLAQHGFIVEKAPGLPPKRDCLRATWDPPWTPRRPEPAPVAPWAGGDRRALVIGAGLAGASAAYSLAQRGWQVTVLDRAGAPAAGASGLPAGVVAPHVSPDDRLLSQLSRSGVMATLARAANLLPEGVGWAASGVLERRLKDSRELPADWADPASPGHAWSRAADVVQRNAAALSDDSPAHWHARAGWVRAPALVAAMLAAPGITWQGNAAVAALRLDRPQAEGAVDDGEGWTALAADGTVLAQAPVVVVAAGFDSLDLLASADAPALPLNPLRGQLLYGPMPDAPHPLPPFPVNGLGNFITGVPVDGTPSWVLGSTFERGCREPVLREADTAEVAGKLAVLLPESARALAPQIASGAARAWAAVRCTVPDRLPVVGAPDASALPGLFVSTGMGARGMTLAVLCGELL
ncbi:MAG: FAD-dependent 5-carboxymethylaminomethyl-2-thiouridine(34) oxidoreductase MnmC, partial [Comamonadaceae bacterium]|nr:FAD-dependent 5-carboxymethylaminomethyl-2-thiouridine(34) oxidoreductase MnmC [Comamonadaceae bacterium]